MQNSTSMTIGTLRTPTRTIWAHRFAHPSRRPRLPNSARRDGGGGVEQQVAEPAEELEQADRARCRGR